MAKAKYDTHVVLVNATTGSRKALELIEELEYESREDAKKDIISEHKEQGCSAVHFVIIPITDFMDNWNNQDDEAEEKISIDNSFFGYIKIRRETK